MNKHIIFIACFALVCSFGIAGLCAEQPNTDPVLRDKKAEILLQSLILAGEREKFADLLTKEIERTNDVERLFRLAELADQENVAVAQESVYRKILRIDPTAIEVKGRLAELLFFSGRFTEADILLTEYLSAVDDDYVSFFYYGEILNHQKKYELSRENYRKALEIIDAMEPPDQDAEIIKAHILYKLHEIGAAYQLFEKLIKEDPDNVSLDLDFIGIMLEMGDHAKAEKALQKYPEDLFAPSVTFPKRYNRSEQEELKLRIGLARVRLLRQTNRWFSAMALLSLLEDRYSKDEQFYLVKADTYNRYEHWRAELKALKQAQKIQPKNEETADRIERLEQEHSSFIAASSGIRITDWKTREVISSVQGEARLMGGFIVGTKVTHNYIWTRDDTTKMNGDDRDSFKGNRYQAEAYIAKEFDNGDVAKLTFYELEGVPGGEARYTLLDYWGNTTFAGGYQKPYWDVPQAVIDNGTRDFLEIGRELRVTNDLTVAGTFSWNRYNLRHTGDLARSIAFDIFVTYKIPETSLQRIILGQDSAVFLNYNFDYEDVYRYERRYDREGNKYRVFDLSDRQVHTATLLISKQFNADIRAEAFGGYAFDQVSGRTGPVFGGSVFYRINRHWQVELTTSQTYGTDKFFYSGGTITYSF